MKDAYIIAAASLVAAKSFNSIEIAASKVAEVARMIEKRIEQQSEGGDTEQAAHDRETWEKCSE